MKTHFKKLKNPNYIGSWDLMDEEGRVKDLTTTITGVKKEMVHDGNGGQEECPVVQLHGVKPLVANSTNLKAISKALGTSFIEEWIGQRITLTVKKIRAFGETHDAIRVLPPAPKKPDLLPNTEQWTAAKAAFDSGSYTIEQIKTKYSLTPENEKLLCSK
jgi:hypothetical protein